jgi:preprotein translocase SecE subunit
MAKTRAQRKAERRAREAEGQKRSDGGRAESRAQHDTQVPVSGDIAEIEAMEAGMAAGAPEEQLETPDAPKPRSHRRAEAKAQKEAEKRQRDEQKRRESEQLAKKQKQAKTERQRSGVIGFLVSCWQELKKVQWPDRDTLIQATAVTILFVTVAAAYLGALDAFFNFLIQRIL